MKKLMIIAVLCLTFVFAGTAMAKSVTLEWLQSVGADGYKIYKSEDNGATWDAGVDVGNVLTYIYPDIPDVGMILFRVSAYNANGEAVSYKSGAWYDGGLTPPMLPTNLGINDGGQ